MMDLASLSSQFKAIGDPYRLRILQLLAREELSVGELVRILELPQSTVSRQLKPLKEQGLVADRPVGSATYYQVPPAVEGVEPSDRSVAMRDVLMRLLRESPLAPGDQGRLDRVVALREGGEEFFDRIGLRWDAMREECFGAAFHLEAFLGLLSRGWTVADLGTGTGYLLPPLGRHFVRAIGVDVNRPMLDLARRRVEEAGLANVELREGALERLPIADGEIDLAVCLLMLHHLEDVAAALREIARALKPGGKILIVELERHDNERFRVGMADRRPGIEPGQLRGWLAESGFADPEAWSYPPANRPDHELAPIPALYGMSARRL
jgi:ArsR family transcriptional regulator